LGEKEGENSKRNGLGLGELERGEYVEGGILVQKLERESDSHSGNFSGQKKGKRGRGRERWGKRTKLRRETH